MMKEMLGFASQRTALKNAPDVKAAKVAQNEVNAQAAIKTDVARKDADAIRKDLAE